ncbi:TPA: hypothetical protein ACJCWQ_003684 [Yersinia enterocolitica]
MNTIEMHGLITGKCVAGDMKVNENVAEYLVRKIANIEDQRNAALNTCTLIGEALGIKGAVAGDTIAKVHQLVGENAVLTDKAASELSNAWLLHRTVMGTQAALFCITQGNLSQAREWLEGTTDEAQLEFPDGMEVNGLQGWFDENMAGHITHAKAVEIIKAEMSATTQAINEIKAKGRVEADKWRERAEKAEAQLIKAEKGEVLVTVSGFTGCGKSAVAGEIEIALLAIGVPARWTNGDAEKRMTGADYLTALEMYKPHVRIVERNIAGGMWYE